MIIRHKKKTLLVLVILLAGLYYNITNNPKKDLSLKLTSYERINVKSYCESSEWIYSEKDCIKIQNNYINLLNKRISKIEDNILSSCITAYKKNNSDYEFLYKCVDYFQSNLDRIKKDFPKNDISKFCNQDKKVYQSSFSCKESEANFEIRLRKNWTKYTDEERLYCSTVQKIGSYKLLLNCLESLSQGAYEKSKNVPEIDIDYFCQSANFKRIYQDYTDCIYWEDFTKNKIKESWSNIYTLYRAGCSSMVEKNSAIANYSMLSFCLDSYVFNNLSPRVADEFLIEPRYNLYKVCNNDSKCNEEQNLAKQELKDVWNDYPIKIKMACEYKTNDYKEPLVDIQTGKTTYSNDANQNKKPSYKKYLNCLKDAKKVSKELLERFQN